MPKPKPPPKADDKEQSERFIETAREIEADESGDEFERALDLLLPTKAVKRRTSRSRQNGKKSSS